MAKRTVLHTVLCRFESCLVYVMAKGDYGLTEIKGALGFFVGFGLFLSGDASRFTHAFIDIGDGKSVEARPALALLRLGVRPKWLTRYVADKGRLICSQLVDEAYRLGGIHLFNDGRPSQDVTPGDLTYVGNVY
jgi:cell wall-associated NlpC family hydrolase